MVLDNLSDIFFIIITSSAVLSAITGMIMLEAFFKHKLKQLFNDVNYLIYFFMVAGYFLYALGEVSFYLSKQFFKDTSAIGIQDVYWTGGAFLILFSFIALAITLFKTHGGTAKLAAQLISGAVLLTVVIIVISGKADASQDYFFSSFYAIISSLIVTAASSVILFYRQLETIAKPLLLFFLASSSILLGDIFFHYSIGALAYGLMEQLSDIFYLGGYTFSWIAFISLRIHLHRASLELETRPVRSNRMYQN